MTPDERLCFDRAMLQWHSSLKRPDMSEKDRVKGALLAYQRQWLVLEVTAGYKRKIEDHIERPLDPMQG